MTQGVQDVESGVAASQKSHLALEEILKRIGEVFMQINQIAAAAQQQTATTCAASSSILQITSVAEQTALGADETSSSATLLAGQAAQLQALVGSIKME